MEDSIDVKKHSRYFFLTCFIILTALSLYLVNSLLIPIVGSILLTYIFYPVYRFITKYLRSKAISSIITTLIILVIIVIPIFFAANAVINESVAFFHEVRGLDVETITEKASEYIGLGENVFGQNIDINFYFRDILNKITITLAQQTSDFIFSLPEKMLGIFVMVFILFYLFIDGEDLIRKIEEELPLKRSYKRDIFERFGNIIYATIYGVVVTGVAQGALGALGLWIFGFSSPLLWGIVMVILSILPFVGAYIVWLPAAIFKIFQGELFNGIGLLLYGILIISTIDNIIKPRIIGKRGKIHPVLVLLGVFGGIKVFGLLGVMIGPLILAIFTAFIEIYLTEKQDLNLPYIKKPE